MGSITSWQVPNKLEESLRRIFDLLKLESNRRLSLKWVGEERSVSREQILHTNDHHALKVHISLQRELPVRAALCHPLGQVGPPHPFKTLL